MEVYLSVSELSKNFGVSPATIYNWQKGNIIPTKIKKDEIENLKTIVFQKRANKRANKKASVKRFIPKEYLEEGVTEAVLNCIEKIVSSKSTLTEKIALCTLLYLHTNEEFSLVDTKIVFKRDSIHKILEEFNPSFTEGLHEALREYQSISIPQHIDFIGMVYQSLKEEGLKSEQGSYYTPLKIVNEMFDDLTNPYTNILDPCCGTGIFLTEAVRRGLSVKDAYGIDIDQTAVFIAKINLLLCDKEYDEIPHIYSGDALTDPFIFPKIDLILSNPPYGAHKNDLKYASLENVVGNNETFSLFIYKSMDYLKENGELSFLLPYSILNIGAHKNIREIICKNTTIHKIVEYGSLFSGVFSKIISIHLVKKISRKKNISIKNEKGEQYEMEQEKVLKNKEYIFDISANETDSSLIDSIYKVPHFQLHKENSMWALGIVTGNNEKYISNIQKENSEPIYKGKNIMPFCLEAPDNFIVYNRSDYQQVASDNFYRAKEKLIYRFISNRLVFAYDNKGSLTINSANILIPNVIDYNMKLIAGFLNSELFQYLFIKKFNTHKVLKKDIMQLPFPILNNDQKQQMLNIIDPLIKQKTDLSHLNKFVYSIFDLNDDQNISHIKNTIYGKIKTNNCKI